MARTEVTGRQIKDQSVSLTADVTDVLPVANGGTGNSTITSGGVLVGNGTDAVATVSPGTSGYVLTSNGTAWVSAASSGEVTLNGAETLYNKTISGTSNTLTNIPVTALSTTGSAGSTTYLRGDGTWAAAGGSAPDLLFNGGGNVDRDLAVGAGPQQFGHNTEIGSWEENQLVTFSDQTSGSDLVYFGRLRIQFAGGFGWAYGLHEILSVTGTTHDDTSSVWLMSFVAAPQVEVTANKGQAGGYASLDGDSRVPVAQIPPGLVVDDVAVVGDGFQFYSQGDPVGDPVSLLVAEIDGGSPSATDIAFYDGGTV